jgi:hypothetical protein
MPTTQCLKLGTSMGILGNSRDSMISASKNKIFTSMESIVDQKLISVTSAVAHMKHLEKKR